MTKIKVMKVKLAKKFDAILQDINKTGRNTKPISVKSHGSNISPHPPITKLLNARKTALKTDYELDEVFESFDEIDNNCHKLNEYNPRTSNMINRKN